ncbi:MAG: LptF/LptG family permease, partial [Gemmatimonadales bacterium]
DGSIHQYRPAEPETFQLTYYHINDIRVKNVFDELERNTSEAVRGDREMSTCEMISVIHDARKDQDGAERDRRELLLSDLRNLLALPPLPPLAAPDTTVKLPRYCHWLESVQGAVVPRPAEAQTPEQTPGQGAAQAPGPKGLPKPLPSSIQTFSQRPTPAPTGRIQLSNWSQVATALDRVNDADHRADRFEVEVHKKWAISMACVSFVIIGIVMALRFPRGGIGLVIGGGLLIFSIHYVGLTAGESLADRGLVSPWLAMWAPNIALTILGLIGLLRVSRESGSTRGGDFQEVVDAIRHIFRRRRAAQG